MLEERKDIDAVLVSTPDHHHAPASVMAMKLGKHVYCQKPLTHSIYEARRMREVAREMKVVTQMGNQGHAFEGARRIVEVFRSGAIGEVREVHCWTDRPNGHWWKQPVAVPSERPPVPAGLDWDLWLGPAPKRAYHRIYCPHDWRAWWDFGSGALGDMACHIVDSAYWARADLPRQCGGPVARRHDRFGAGLADHQVPISGADVALARRDAATRLAHLVRRRQKTARGTGQGNVLPRRNALDRQRRDDLHRRRLQHRIPAVPEKKFEGYQGPKPYLPRNPRTNTPPTWSGSPRAKAWVRRSRISTTPPA